MSEPFIGEIRMFGGNFPPQGWALCNGGLLSIASNQALFSILGTTYGGNGQTTFGLPDLQGRVPINWGQGAGLSPHLIGEMDGVENVSLIPAQMPAHSHTLSASSALGSSPTATGNFPAGVDNGNREGFNAFSPSSDGIMASAAIGASGGGLPHTNMQPYLCITFIIALQGIYPSRQ